MSSYSSPFTSLAESELLSQLSQKRLELQRCDAHFRELQQRYRDERDSNRGGELLFVACFHSLTASL